jgi:steroid 5-alpha reductase family enzyme
VWIAGIQNVLLLLLGIPTYVAATQPPQPLGGKDYGVAALALFVLALEFTSDNQQFAYQSFKHEPKRFHKYQQWPGARLDWTAADAERGFLTRGLWAWSRHPNFACEQSFWVRVFSRPFCAKL